MANLDINFSEFERIYPTENDIAFAQYNGVNGSEVNYSKNLTNRYLKNCILPNIDGSGNPTGFAGFLVVDAGGADVAISRGRAYIEGRYVEMVAGADFTVTVDTDKDTYIYLQLNISGSVQVTPPARFITVSVAHKAIHARPSNAVLLAKIVTNATPDIVGIVDLRPSQMCDRVKLADMNSTSSVTGITPPVGYTYMGTLDFGEILFNKSLCNWYDVTGYPVGQTIDIETIAIGDENTFYSNTYQTPVFNSYCLAAGHIAFGFVNVFNTGVNVRQPIGYGANIYHIYAKLTGTIPFGASLNGLLLSSLKEWSAVG
jgi:hypothetical protein